MAPSEPTIQRTVTPVDADEADVLVGRWPAERVRAGRVEARQVSTCTALALDGKTLKGSWAELNTGSGKVRLFSALGHGEGVVVGQRTLPADTNELTTSSPRSSRCWTRSPCTGPKTAKATHRAVREPVAVTRPSPLCAPTCSTRPPKRTP